MNTYYKLLTSITMLLALAIIVPVAKADPIHNVVLVHGAFADGSGWQPVYEQLVKKGFNVSVVQEPETSYEDDVATTLRVITMQDGPVVLVGHSYGGQIISGAGVDPKVKALVYVAAFAPDIGDSVVSLLKRIPAAGTSITSAGGGYLMIDPARFHADFCADLSEEQANFMARSQVVTNEVALNAPAKVAAWHDKPSFAIVAEHDRTINPDLERWMYKRAGSKVTEVPNASHAVMMSHPDIIVSVIEQAAQQ